MINIEKTEKYSLLNRLATRNGVVFFGADWLSDIPVAEIARDSGFDGAVYNRSLKGITVADAQQVIDVCIVQLNPDKVFINIGENDITKENFNMDDFIEKFEWLLYTVNSKCRCRILILPVITDGCGEINGRIREVAQKYSCEFIDINLRKISIADFFRHISFFLRSTPITFFEAMNI